MKTGADVPVKVSAVRDIFDRNGIPDLVTAEKRRYQAEAFGHFDAVEVPGARKAALRGMMEELLVREH